MILNEPILVTPCHTTWVGDTGAPQLPNLRVSPVTPSARISRSILFGLIIGALFLARLDTVFIAPILLTTTAYVWGNGRATQLRNLIVSAAASLAIVAPYLVWNIVLFGHVVPVSGTAKIKVPWSIANIIDGLLIIPRTVLHKLPGPDAGWIVVLLTFVAICIVAIMYRNAHL